MKVISPTTIIMYATVMAGVATASNPIGQSCTTPGVVGQFLAVKHPRKGAFPAWTSQAALDSDRNLPIHLQGGNVWWTCDTPTADDTGSTAPKALARSSVLFPLKRWARQIFLQLDLESQERTTHFGLRRRATEVLSALPRTSHFLNKSTALVSKLFWPEEARQSEPDILEDVCKIAKEEPDVLGHVPEMGWSGPTSLKEH
ncbi:hypothetical protein DEU56DRAFT_928845 [Suillus clintonianus]|uniref:uncharacterized protein n=1 Tax=Suillus clintonianus TaxID=1904413 RepID=UPI001B87D08B|nr:uncharacterized protein DEU56DRAFT_928845 [Suillus clintonianus]KAG2119441.1 hypothetical protein DEU56DRAFT_928845 [Suillus clintonianus]